jgi:hypothetical protein
MENNKFIDTCRLLGNYNNQYVYLYNSAKYEAPRIFYTPNYYYLPKWADPEKSSLLRKNNKSQNKT